MSKQYNINEIFYSLQGEGRWAGRAAIFVRFSGCNLRCPFCDTDFTAHRRMTAEEILLEVKALNPTCRFLVFTGGEPTLQLDDALVDAFHADGYYLTIETNGTHPYPAGIDWVTLSPKDIFTTGGVVNITHADELKLVFDSSHPIATYDSVKVTYRYLQPCDTGEPERNRDILSECIDYIKAHPEWQLSLQQHKIINIQ